MQSDPNRQGRTSLAPSGTVGLRTVEIGVAICIVLLFVNAALFQIQMALTGGRIPVATNPIVLFAMVLIALVVVIGRLKSNSLTAASAVTLAYILVDGYVLSSTTKYSINDIRQSLTSSLLPLLVVGLAAHVPLNIKWRYTESFFITALIVCAGFSAVQFATNSAVVPISSVDGNFMVPSHMLEDHIRAFSLFTSGLHAGVFYVFTAGIGTSLLFRKRCVPMGGVVLALSSFGCYATLTRLTIIGMAACVASVAIIRARFLARLTPFLPMLWLATALVVIATSGTAPGVGTGSGVMSTSSLNDRLVEWEYYKRVFESGNVVQLFFGTALSPWTPVNGVNRPSTSAPLPLDNAYLGLLLNCGILGLCVVGFFCWKAWTTLYRRALSEQTSLMAATAGIFATLPLFGTVNEFLPEFLLVVMIANFTPIDQRVSNLSHQIPISKRRNQWAVDRLKDNSEDLLRPDHSNAAAV